MSPISSVTTGRRRPRRTARVRGRAKASKVEAMIRALGKSFRSKFMISSTCHIAAVVRCRLGL